MFKPAIRTIASAVLACCAFSANATVIDFNNLAGSAAPNGGQSGSYTYITSSFSLNGYTFNPSYYTQYWIGTAYSPSDSYFQPYNGTDYLLAYDVTITRDTNQPFSLSGLDLATWDGWYAQYYQAPSIQLIGTHAGGAQDSATFAITNFNQSQLTGNDFTHFAPGAAFSNLTSLRIVSNSGSYFTLDNLDIGNNVPEPGSLALLGLGIAGIAAARRRKQR